MAKVLLSALLDSLTGKLSGSVFQLGPGGLQVRTKVSPRNPASAKQQFVRGNYSWERLIWPLLTQLQRDSWINNSPVDVQGSSFFVSQNQKIASSGQPLINEFTSGTPTAIITPTFDQLDTANFIIGPSTIIVTLPANTYLNIFATRPLSPGQQFISPSDYIFIVQAVPGAATDSPIDITTKYFERFPELPEFYLIGLKYYTINVVNGYSSDPLFASANVTAAP